MVHLRWPGGSREFSLDELGVNTGASDRELKARLAARLEVSAKQLGELVVDRRPHGDIVVRPPAVYG